MPPRGVKKGTKRARQYEHVKEGLLERGASEDRAERIERVGDASDGHHATSHPVVG